MQTFQAALLRTTAQAILEASGAPPESAKIVSDSLVEANLAGHDSHGVIRLVSYVQMVRKGKILPTAQPSVTAQHGASAHVDGAWGWGQVAAQLATQTTIALAGEYGVGATTVDHCNHIGRLGEYVETIARAGMAAIALCNAESVVAPFGGRQGLMGTNPIAMAVPRASEQSPLFMDFATAGVAEGKLRVARDKGERVAPGLILDKQGQPSQEPADFYAGGTLLPFGGHKGYGLSVMAELFGGALSGMAPSALSEYRGGNGTLLLALNVAAFVPLAQFRDQAERLCTTIHASPPAAGGDAVLLPGDPELAARKQRTETGIPLPEQTWADIQALAQELGVPPIHD